MKKIALFLAALMLHSIIALSQTDEKKTFVVLKDGSIKYHDNIWLKNYSVYSNTENKEIYPFNDFKFVNAENGFYANTSNVRNRKAPFIAKKTIDGEVNFFESQTIILYSNSTYTSGNTEGSLLRPKSYYNYYNTGFNDILPVSYDKLKVLFSSNIESVNILEKSRKDYSIGKTFNIASAAIQITGSALFIYNMFQIRNSTFPKDKKEFYKPFIVSASIVLTGSFVGFGKNVYYAKANESLREAFFSYNGIE